MNERTHHPKLYIYGKNPVIEFLERTPKRVSKIFFKRTLDPKTRVEIEKYALQYKIPFQVTDERSLSSLATSGVHQGIVALITEAEFMSLESWLESIQSVEKPCAVLLDELEDPQNVGAIIRTATALGVDGILIGKHHQAPISGGVYKASAGTVGIIPLVRVGNINDAIRTLKEHKFWIVGLSMTAKKAVWDEDLAMPVCFIVGAEGKGIRQVTLNLADFLISIPMEHNVESLNVSASTAIVLSEWRKQAKRI